MVYKLPFENNKICKFSTSPSLTDCEMRCIHKYYQQVVDEYLAIIFLRMGTSTGNRWESIRLYYTGARVTNN